MIKTYVSTKTISLTTSIIDKTGKAHQIKFENGATSPFKRYAKFTTADKVIQDALESDPAFNVYFALESSVEEPKKNKVTPPQGSNDSGSKSDTPITASEVTDFAQARDYMVNLNDGLTKSILKSKAIVLEEATKRNITFPNLK